MYAKDRGFFYLQLEDGVLAVKVGDCAHIEKIFIFFQNFISTIKHFALGKTAERKPWFVIDFGCLGFSGRMFKSVDLPWVVNYFLMFYNDQPGGLI